MIDKLSTTIFLVGILILIVPNVILLRKKTEIKYTQLVTLSIYTAVSIFALGFAWLWREKKAKEKYDYNYAIRSGQLVGGAVFASYPDNVPGLGWI